MHDTLNSLPDNARKAMVSLLNARLADALDLFSQVKQAHWTVKGPAFIALHELFDKVAADTLGHVDLIAERVQQLGGTAAGTVRAAAGKSALKEYPLAAKTGSEHVVAVASALAQFTDNIRKAISESDEAGDPVTADMLTQIASATDKNLWFVEAHRQVAA